MKMKLYKAILHTAGKTDAQIRKESTFPIDKDEISIIRATYDAWDGVECMVIRGDYYHKKDEYAYAGPLPTSTDENREKIKEAFYRMEQDPFFGMYFNQRAEFDRDFDAGDYNPDAQIVFNEADVEVIGEIMFSKEGACSNATD